ncbi:MAG: DUF4954 family protein [Bacteroidetes bacterium]|nr:DUF4954 family protein [Bacteroidota bacterium]MBS1648250.1 DUF4954 family protein [Bacteroidota bacterium]
MQQNNIIKSTITSLGYDFIKKEYIPKGKNEYYLRNLQNRSGIDYRNLTAYEIEALVKNRNTCDDWNKILVSNAFNPELVKNCKFFGLVRIGKLEPYCLTFSDLKVPVGLYNSTIISCDFGDNVVVDNVSYMSHYIVGNEVILININELVTTNHAKFGNGIVKEGEDEEIRIWLEICNENAGRKVIPFNGMLPGDAYLWSKFRDDDILLEKFKQLTEKKFNRNRGYYGKIGDRTVIKNCSIIKDVWVGKDAYIKGASKMKNLTINSGEEGKTQIGEGCELVNGIIDFGCKIFYGVKAVRFIMASHSQLKYGARLINSYLGNNATISCCEVLNSLIFPAHEQHHNNSFLCAALLMGQSNVAAGATLGSNHNSRSADGEAIMGRGFWPGLCVSIKHNSKFASFTILAKGDYQNELNISIPFSLVSINESNKNLTIMPAYWFMYNMYALVRNSWKYIDRDKRNNQIQLIEYHYLAPDTINEMFASLPLIEEAVGKAFLQLQNQTDINKELAIKKGKLLLQTNDKAIDTLEIFIEEIENSKRKVQLLKAREAYNFFVRMIQFYGVQQLTEFIKTKNIKSIQQLQKSVPARLSKDEWLNVGGQLMPTQSVNKLNEQIKLGKINTWDAVHSYYLQEGKKYEEQKTKHALASLIEISKINLKKIDKSTLNNLLESALDTQKLITTNIFNSRKKDYTNTFRKMMYSSEEEMNNVLGSLQENTFIKQQKEVLKNYTKQIATLKKQFSIDNSSKK